MGGNHLDAGLGNNFFVSGTKAKATKAKIKKWDYMKPNNFCITNKSINKMNGEPIKLQEILPNHISDKWSTQFSSVSWSYPTLCNPMDYSISGFCAHHQLLELIQTHVP